MKRKLYLDLDGVLADFDKAAAKLGAVNEQEMWEKAKEIPHWFLGFDLMPDARRLFNWCVKNFETEILTALPKPERNMNTVDLDKRTWVKIHFGDIPVNTCLGKEKQNYAHKSILVDDTPRNVGQFMNRGGIGILHTNAEDTIEALKELRELQ